ncbi:uncharacterized protein LOC126053873 [Helicoverpa armigera]|uniref:uncharacterized protein LOC126053873 n=1 Tax=Helicoverpa armigera TaxID=29058 RepID=UPI00308354A6
MSTKDCAGCLNGFNCKEGLQCSTCHQWYDLLCANINMNVFKTMNVKRKSTWKCPICHSQLPKSDNTNTPVRTARLASPTSERSACLPPRSPSTNVTIRKHASKQIADPTSDETCLQFSEHMLRDIIKDEIQIALTDIVSTQFKQMHELINDFKKSLSFFNEKYEEMKTMLEERSMIIKKLEKDNSGLRDDIHQVNQRLNLLEQNSRTANVELQCVPENKSENLITTVLQLGKVINCDITDPDILHCTRLAKKDTQSSRPRSILVKFSSPRLRDSFLAASIRYNKNNNQDKLNTSHLGIASDKPQPIYVSEHLSAENKAIHAAARVRAKELGFKFVWVRNGRIFVKKDELSQRIHITCRDKLKSLE